MSVVINMQQRRTVATGRQNQDPNTAVKEKEPTPKKLCPKIERSIQGVLNHTRNTSGRGRQMVLAALQKNAQAAAVKKSPRLAAKTSQSGTDAGGSLKSNGHKGSKATPLTPKGTEENRLSITDIRKRPLEPVEREPLSATAHNEPEKQWPDWTISPGKPVQNEETLVYKKRHKVEAAPAMESTSSDPSQELFSLESPHQVQKPTQKSETIIAKPAAGSSDPYALSPAKSPLPTDLEREPASNVSLDSVPLEIEAEPQPFSFIPKGLKKFHGLMNLGNTCYMNVVLQILYSLPSFVSAMERLSTNFLRQDATNTEDSEVPPSPSNDSVFAALLQVFLDLRGAGRFETVNSSLLKRAFAKKQASFWGSVQQDAHEFLCSLIDHVQEEVSSLLRRQSDDQADCLKLDTVCPTTQNFSCTVRNSLTCAECGNVSSVEETYRDFSLALPEDERNDETKVCSLESLLRLYFQLVVPSVANNAWLQIDGHKNRLGWMISSAEIHFSVHFSQFLERLCCIEAEAPISDMEVSQSTFEAHGRKELEDAAAFSTIANSEGEISICGFGSLLSEKSALYTFPNLRNFREAILRDFRRVFAHVAPVFLDRGIANVETKELSSLSVEPCKGESIVVTVFEISVSEIPAFIAREHEFRFLAVTPEDKDGQPFSQQAVVCARYSDEEYRRIRCQGNVVEYHMHYGRYNIEQIWRDDIFPCRVYLRHCVLAAKNLGLDAYNSFLDHTYLGDRITTIRQYLESGPGAGVMEEEPPPALRDRYGG